MDLTSRVTWRKSSYSSSSGDNCIEVGSSPRTVAVRDSKDPNGPTLAFTSIGWQAFTRRLRKD
jgi:hypothetical protein